MFGSTLLGAAAGLLVALDGMHVVLSRTALLDIFLMFFLVAAFGALLLDREAGAGAGWPALDRRPASAPRPGWRSAVVADRRRGAAGVRHGGEVERALRAGSSLLVVVWEAGARRSPGVRRPLRRHGARRVPWAGRARGASCSSVYLATWTGWFATDTGTCGTTWRSRRQPSRR